MMWVYQILDIISTATEAISVYLFSSWLCKKPRFSGSTNKCIIIGIYFLSIYAMTWFTGLGVLGSGEINHFGPDENRQSRVASPQVVLFTRPAAGQPVSQ